VVLAEYTRIYCRGEIPRLGGKMCSLVSLGSCGGTVWTADAFRIGLRPVERYANTSDAGNELREVPDFHTEMETKMKMNW
jgi:hypothetical protein